MNSLFYYGANYILKFRRKNRSLGLVEFDNCLKKYTEKHLNCNNRDKTSFIFSTPIVNKTNLVLSISLNICNKDSCVFWCILEANLFHHTSIKINSDCSLPATTTSRSFVINTSISERTAISPGR